MELQEILGRFANVRKCGENYSARCPGPGHAHGDRHNSLTIYLNTTDNGKEAVYFKCGLCTHDEIREAVGLEPKDLFLGDSPNYTNTKTTHSAKPKTTKVNITSEKYERSSDVAPLRAYDQDEYHYTDATGKVVAQKVRKEGKRFFWEPTKYEVLNSEGSFPVVFRLDRLLKAPKDESIFVCEGEKDVLTMESLGKTAICLPYGASKTSDFPDIKENVQFHNAIAGRTLIVLPDFDDVGRTCAFNFRKTIYNLNLTEKVSIAILDWKNLEPEICRLEKKNDSLQYYGAGFDLTDFIELHPEDGIARIIEAARANLRTAALKAEKLEQKKLEKKAEIQKNLDKSLELIGDLLSVYPGLRTFYDQYANKVLNIDKKELKDITDRDRQIKHDFEQSLKEAKRLYDMTVKPYDNKLRDRALDILNVANASILESVIVEDVFPIKIDKSAFLQLLIDEKYAYTHDGRLWLYNDKKGIFESYGVERQGEIYTRYTKIYGNEQLYNKKSVDEFKSQVKNLEDSHEEELLAAIRPEMTYIAFKNGTFSLNERKLIPHSPEHLLKYQINANFDEDFFNLSTEEIQKWTVEESRFYRMLREIQPDPIDQLDILMHFGLILSPHATTGKIPLICYYGSGTNGKGTLVDLMMNLIVDEREHNANLPWERLVSKRGFDLSKLDGKSFNVVPDTSSPSSGSDAMYFGAIKSLITGEPFSVEHKYADVVTIHPNITSILCLNRLPNLSEKGPSTEKRFHIVPFNKRIGSQKEVEEGTKDLIDQDRNNLVQDVLQEKDRLVVLFVLALYELQNRGWKLPESQSYAATKEGWLSDSDPIQDFCSKYVTKTKTLKEIPKDQRVATLESFSFSLDDFFESIKCYLLIKGTEKKKLPSKDMCRHQIEQVMQIKPERKLLPDGSRPTRYYGYSLSAWKNDRVNRFHLDDPDKYDKLLMNRYNPAWETQPSQTNAIPESTSALLAQKDQKIASLEEELGRMKEVIAALKQAAIDEYNNSPNAEDPLAGFDEVI